MSAIRTLHGLVDLGEYHPWNSEHEVFDPVIRKATPEELARLDGPDIGRIVDSIGLIPRPIRGRYTDAERAARIKRDHLQASVAQHIGASNHRRAMARLSDETLAAVLTATGGRVKEAAGLLHIPPTTVYRRIAQAKARGAL